ncbi:MAG: DivIVA domain-containing protein [Acidimicrobiales bacterium]
MDESEAVEEEVVAATPIFGVYRRGYDPEQVDRYVAEQQRRLDDAIHRASESERKLAAAVGQLRELHRRVAVYESEARSAQPPQLDTLGERVQRILQEAWEGAYNLRQEAERDVNDLRQQAQEDVEAMRVQARAEVDELREVASREAAEVVDEATRRALHIRDETERRRQAYLERVERDREQAISQITYLYDQRQGAIAELARLQATVQATIEEMVRSPLGRPSGGVAEAAAESTRVGRASAGRAHPAGAAQLSMPGVGPGPGTASGTILGERPVDTRPSEARPADMRPSEARSTETLQGDGHLRSGQDDEWKMPSQEAHPGAPSAGIELPILTDHDVAPAAASSDPSLGADVPTGPMERYVRPGDRDELRRAGAEADAMERAIRAASQAPEIKQRRAAPQGVYDAEQDD